MSHYKANNYPSFDFTIDLIPPTSNHIWKTDFRRKTTYLTKEAKQFRSLVGQELNWRKKVPSWVCNPSGSVSLIAIFESSMWLPKNSKKAIDIALMIDADYRIKSISDAIGSAVGYPDHRAWEVHAFKLYSTIERTHVFIFDLGQNIDYHKA